MADLAAEDGGSEGEGSGGQADQQDEVGATTDPVGPKAKENQAGQTGDSHHIDKRGGFLRHFLVHLHGDVAPVVERGLDLAGVEAVVGAVTGVHDERGHGAGEEAKGEGNGEDRVATGDQPGNQDGADDDGEGDGEMVKHHVEVLGLPEGGDHGPRVGRKGGLFQRKVNG
jgi:hypothetical protein